MSAPSLFIAMPTKDNRVHVPCLMGLWQLQGVVDCVLAPRSHGDISTARDALTAAFLQSDCTHMLSLDSDLGFSPADVLSLLARGLPAVCGTYCRRDGTRSLPFWALDDALAAAEPVVELEAGAMGFALLERAAVERVWAHWGTPLEDVQGVCRPSRVYYTKVGALVGLWSAYFDPARGQVDDSIAFCERWRAAGERIYWDRSVVVTHYGEVGHVP